MLPGLKVAIDNRHYIQATVLPDSALIIYCDERKRIAKLPRTANGERVDRLETLEILTHFLDTEELHPDYLWTETDQIPYSERRLGCTSVLVLLAAVAAILSRL